MFSGNKGTGKATLVNHLLFSIFDIENYDFEKFSISTNSTLFNRFFNAKVIFFKLQKSFTFPVLSTRE